MKRLLLLLILLGIPFYGVSQVGINTTSPNAQLDIKSSNQATPTNTDGILIPKIDAFPLVNPTAAQQGMMVYLTTISAGKPPGFYYWDNPTVSWIGIAGSKGWDVIGNGGTNPATNFIGTTDDNDFAFRRNSLPAGKIGQFSTSIGVNSMTLNTAGNNTAFGNQTLPVNTTGNSNTAMGTTALFSNTIGNSNLAIGYGALNQSTTASNNTAIGNNALFVQSFSNGGAVYATNNTAVGESALFSNNPNSTTTGKDNTALGYNALYGNTTGSSNIAIGANADVPSATANNQMSIGNVIYGADMSTTALGKIGIGVPVPTVKLDVNETTNTKNTVVNVTHSNPTAATKIIKTNVNSGALASGVITANENALVLANSVQGIGVANAISGTTSDDVYGFRNFISNTGTSIKFGLSNSFTGAGTGSVYGVSNRFSTLTSTQQNGVFNSFGGTPTGASIGLNNAIEDNGNGVKIGVLDSITNGGNGNHYGIKNAFKGNGSGRRYGMSSVFSGNGNGEIWGTFTDVNGTGNGNVVGHYIGNNRAGTGDHYGIQTYLSGDTTGAKYGVDNYLVAYNAGVDPQQGVSNFITGSNDGAHTGVSNWLSGEGDGIQYGTYNYIDNSGIGIKYGTYNRILSGLNGLHYGVYSDVTKANSYAGYFLGRVSIGTTAANSYILPSSRGTLNQILQTDGSGNVSWQNPTSIPNGTAIGNTMYWNGTTWVNNSNFLFNNGTAVGINTPAPSSLFTIRQTGIGLTQEDATGVAKIGFYTNNTGAWLQTHSNTDLKFATNNGATQMVLLAANGNLGINTLAPGEKLEVVGKTKTTDLQVTNGAATGRILTSDAVGNATWQNPSTVLGNLAWSTTGNAIVATNFLGTTNDFDLVFKRNNVRSGYIGISNNSFGVNALNVASTGNYNNAFGWLALSSNTTGSQNAAFGSEVLFSNSSGNNNSGFGYRVLNGNTVGGDNSAFGNAAMLFNTSASKNTAVGYRTLAIQGFANGGVAYDANNVAIGNDALYLNNPTTVTNGINNTGVGSFALTANTTGYGNVALGYRALVNNTTGFNNTCIGNNVFPTSSTSLNNYTGLGYNVGGGTSASNMVEVGNTSVTSIRGQVSFTTYSDKRIKNNIQENVPGLSFITQLRPVTYNLDIHKQNAIIYKDKKETNADWEGKYDIENIKQTGFIAQEVAQTAKGLDYDFSGVDAPKEADGLYGLRYAEFVVPLVKAVQEQQEIIEAQNEKIKVLESANEEILKRLEKLEKQ